MGTRPNDAEHEDEDLDHDVPVDLLELYEAGYRYEGGDDGSTPQQG